MADRAQNVERGGHAGRDAASRREARRAAQHYLELVGVGDAADQLPAQLSLGTQQCVSLARALSVEPRFLLLDEPFSHARFADAVRAAGHRCCACGRQSGKTVVMVTHDVDEALYLADRLILMTDGPEATVGDVLHGAVPAPAQPRRRARRTRATTRAGGTSSTSSSTTPTSRARARLDDVLARRLA